MKIVSLLLLGLIMAGCAQQEAINSFEACVAAGNPVMESYPRQCAANGRTFTEEITFKNDGIDLLETAPGEMGCFGCGNALCVDPIAGLKQIEETEDLHCNGDFAIVDAQGNVIQESPWTSNETD